MVQPDVAAKEYAPKEPPGVKGEGAIAFGGGSVLTDKGRAYLKEVDAVQLDGEEPAASAPAPEPVAA